MEETWPLVSGLKKQEGTENKCNWEEPLAASQGGNQDLRSQTTTCMSKGADYSHRPPERRADIPAGTSVLA